MVEFNDPLGDRGDIKTAQADLQNQISAANADLQNIDRQIADVQSRRTRAESTLVRLRGRSQDLERQAQQLEQQAQQLRQEAQQAQQEYEAASAAVTQANLEITDLERSKSGPQDQITNAQREMNNLSP